MTFQLVYYKDGQEIGSTPWTKSLDDGKKFATYGLIRNNGDEVEIIDVDAGSSVVWSNSRKLQRFPAALSNSP